MGEQHKQECQCLKCRMVRGYQAMAELNKQMATEDLSREVESLYRLEKAYAAAWG